MKIVKIYHSASKTQNGADNSILNILAAVEKVKFVREIQHEAEFLEFVNKMKSKINLLRNFEINSYDDLNNQFILIDYRFYKTYANDLVTYMIMK